MSTATTSNFKLIKRIKSESFSSKSLPSYTLCLLVGIKDFQFAVIDKQQNTCLYIEDYRLENIKTVNSRVEALLEICNSHPLLRSYKWGTIKLVFKSSKFTLVPNSFFIPEAASDYLVMNSDVKTKIEDIYFYKHISTSTSNIFATDKKVLELIKKIYPSKSIQVVHQGRALIEGVLRYDDHSHEKSMFAYIDRGVLHLLVTQDKKLLFYNQFSIKESDDYVRYVMLIFKELKLSPKESSLVIWGMIKQDSPHLIQIKKYIKNISLGHKPNFLTFTKEFEDLSDHRYFDLYSIFLCE
ncbi:MAG: DUF3822 family protein [Cyclobacteriaceae bacterium]